MENLYIKNSISQGEKGKGPGDRVFDTHRTPRYTWQETGSRRQENGEWEKLC
jgi:hypothetical protein